LTQKDLYISKGTSTSLNGRDLSENLTSSPITDETNTLLIPIWTESNSKLFKIPNFYDYFTFSYKDNFSSIKLFIKDSSSLIDVSASDSYLELYDLDDSNKKYDIDEDSDEIKNLDKHHNFRAYIKIKFSFDISSVSLESPDLYLTFYRNATDEEIEFAKIADQCPYLEDKLIDFSYFLNHNILSPMEYQDLMNTINNELRIVNGKLMFFAQDYLTAQKTQIKTLANIQSALDSLGGACESDIVSPIKTKGIPSSDLTTFKDKYDSIFSNTASSLAPLLNYNSLYGNYFSLYHKARQRFLKNIYNFRNYFNDRFILAGSNGSLYSYTLTLSSNNLTAEKDSSGNYITGEYSDQYITFNNNDYNLILSDFNHYVQDPNQDDYGKPTLPIYHYNNGSYTSVNVVSKDGLKAGKFFIPKISAGSYVQVKSEKYDYQTKYSLKDGNVFNPIYLIDIIKHEYDTDKSLCK
jgi:hypothetical protein